MPRRIIQSVVVKDPRFSGTDLLLLVIGFLLGYVSWIVGVLWLWQGLRALVHWIHHGEEWLDALKTAERGRGGDSPYFFVPGSLVERSKTRDPWTGHVSFQVIVEYSYQVDPTDNDSSRSTNTRRRCVINGPDGRFLYHNVLPPKLICIQVCKKNPNCVIPRVLLQRKLQDCFLWHRLFGIGFALTCISLYGLGVLTYCLLTTENGTECTICGTCGVVSPLLMLPFIAREQRANHQKRLHSLTHDPLGTMTELEWYREYCWHALGPTLLQKLCSILWIPGVCVMWYVTDGLGIIPGCLAVWAGTKMTSSPVPNRVEYLDAFVKQATTSQGTVRNPRIDPTTKRRMVEVVYSSPKSSTEDDFFITQITQVPTDVLYHQVVAPHDSSSSETINVDLWILPGHHLSGIPKIVLQEIRRLSWSFPFLSLVASFGTTLYLGCAWYSVVLDMGDWWEWIDMVWFVLWAGLGPLLMLPQAYSHHRTRHSDFVELWGSSGPTSTTTASTVPPPQDSIFA